MDFVHATDEVTLEFREYSDHFTLTLNDCCEEVTIQLSDNDVSRIGYRLFQAIGKPVMPCPDEECYYHDGD